MDCYGATGDVTVRIIGSNNESLDVPINSSGNFFIHTSAGIVFPIRAEVWFEGRVRSMCDWQTSGDCNGCHSEYGAEGAPGRVILP